MIESRIFQIINQNRSDESFCEAIHESVLNQNFSQKRTDFGKLKFYFIQQDLHALGLNIKQKGYRGYANHI